MLLLNLQNISKDKHFLESQILIFMSFIAE